MSKPDLTQVAADLNCSPVLDAALQTFTTAAVADSRLSRALHAAWCQASLADANAAESSADLGSFMQTVVGNPAIAPEVRAAAQRVLESLTPVAIVNIPGSQTATGMTIYQPNSGIPNLAYAVARADLFAAESWEVVLTKFARVVSNPTASRFRRWALDPRVQRGQGLLAARHS